MPLPHVVAEKVLQYSKEPTSELIKFEFVFSSTYWNTPPHIDILIGNKLHYSGHLHKNNSTIEFITRLDFADHSLKVIRTGKTLKESKQVDGEWETQSCSLERLTVDGINLRNILWSKSKFVPVYDETQAGDPVIDGECIFGFNGTFNLNFSSPFYQYVVDCVRGAR